MLCHFSFANFCLENFLYTFIFKISKCQENSHIICLPDVIQKQLPDLNLCFNVLENGWPVMTTLNTVIAPERNFRKKVQIILLD